MKETYIEHTFAAVFNKDAQVLIIGTIPSVKSREAGFYYGHPRNRFWKTLAAIYDENLPETIEERTDFLYRHSLALWDVLHSCQISGSKDHTIKNVVVNDFESIIKKTKIHTVFTTGKKAYQLYQKYCYPKTKIEAIYLPSPSPSHCSITDEELSYYYKQIPDKMKNMSN